MSIEIKQKIKEVADDFGMPAKNLIEIVGKFYDKPKSSSQNLTEEQLNVIFDYITAQNQIGSIAEVFAAAKPKDEPKPAAPAPAPQQSQPVQSQQPAPRPQQNQPRPQGSFNNNNNRPAQQQNQRPQFNQRPQPQNQQPRPQQSQPQQQAPQSQNAQNNAQQPAKQPQPERKRERRVIDTSAVTVNADRYDDRVDSLVSERVQNYSSGKQKIGNKNKKQQAKKFGTKNRSEEQEKMRRLQLEIAKKAPLVVKIPDEITVGELASRMKKTAAEVIKCLLKNGVMASVNQTIDYDTAEFVAVELGCKVEREVVVTIEEKLFDDHEDTADELVSRPPVIVVMGHVDHGKTSLLDYIRHAKVAAGEAGGITQHIGAYTVKVGDQPITFLDTPGHAAFTEMRARGAMCTDIAILVVAADDGIMPQTIEAINHAKAANIPIIVAVNKMDKHGANPDRILTQLTEHGLTPADWGGETEVCKISAKTGEGIDDLLETVLLTAEMLELKANPNRAGKGCVLEARLDKTRGPIATLLVQNGTLHQGDIIIAGTAVGRVRAMTDENGKRIQSAGPSVPVEITGLKVGIVGLGVSGRMIADALQFMGAEISYFARSAKPDAEAAGMTFKPLPQLLADSEVVFTCLNKNVLLLGKDEFAQLGEGKVLFNTSIGPGFDSAALEQWLALPGTYFFCDTRAAAGPVSEGFFERENVHCANVSTGRTKQAFVLLSQKVLANIRTALHEG